MCALFSPDILQAGAGKGLILYWKKEKKKKKRGSDVVPLVEFMYLVFTSRPGESYRKRLRSLLLCVCDVFGALSNSLVF